MCRCEAWNIFKVFDQNMLNDNLNKLVYWAKWGKNLLKNFVLFECKKV